MSASKQKTGSTDKSQTKSKKDERYENMLKKIELGLDKPKKTMQIEDDDNDNDQGGIFTQSNNNSKPGGVSVFDLISNLESNEKVTGNNNQVKAHLSDLTTKINTFQEAPSVRKQEELDRKANYQIIKKDVQKWTGLIKKNKESAHLDFTQKNDEKFRINSNVIQGKSKSALEDKVEAKLKQLNLLNEEDILNQEKELLKKLNPDEAKKRQTELAKNRNLMFYQELKNKRVSKIKSKLFHKIKNKREKRMQEKIMANMGQSDPNLQLQELEDLEKKRADERISLRHKNKSKYVKNLLRYGNKKETEQTVNDLAQLRREILKKIDASQKERLQEQMENEDGFYDEDLTDEQFKEKLIQELEEQLKNEETMEEEGGEKGQKKKKLTGFMKRLVEQQEGASKREAEQLLEKLKNVDNLDDFELSDEEEIRKAAEEEDDEEDPEEAKKKKEAKEAEKKKAQDNKPFNGRKKFHKDDAAPAPIEVADYKRNKKGLDTSKILDSYIENQDEQPQMSVTTGASADKKSASKAFGQDQPALAHLDRLEPKDVKLTQSAEKSSQPKDSKKKENETKKKESESKKTASDKDDLVAGLNFGGLRQKYTKGSGTDFLNEEIEKFNEENKQDMYNELSNFQIAGSNIYNEEFAEEKEKLYEDEIPEEKPALKGWGSWTGTGIKEKKEDPNIAIKRKIQKIEELKKQRKDGKLDHVIINDNRNKAVAKYLVQDLPHPYKSARQFDYIQNIALGPDFNTMKNHQKLVKSKIITKVGEIINPIKAPKNNNKRNGV